MKIAVTGPNGQLGRELVKQGATPLRGYLMSEEMTAGIEAIKPDAIINCAAMTDVDGCEKNIFQAVATNTAGVEWLSYRFPGYLVQISTDYVFNGKTGPYEVRDSPSPINIYGWSKLGGELVARSHRGPSLIIRTTILFSSANNNFVAKIVKQLRRGKEVTLYNPGLLGTPTYVPALATEILRIVRLEYDGVAHVAGRPNVTRLEFGHEIARTFGYDSSMIGAFPTFSTPNLSDAGDALRPLVAGLVCDHNKYGKIVSHNYIDGLKDLAKQKGIFNERTMERVEAG
jgi:dTDP-4-dehydrorhamnose reductase